MQLSGTFSTIRFSAFPKHNTDQPEDAAVENFLRKYQRITFYTRFLMVFVQLNLRLLLKKYLKESDFEFQMPGEDRSSSP